MNMCKRLRLTNVTPAVECYRVIISQTDGVTKHGDQYHATTAKTPRNLSKRLRLTNVSPAIESCREKVSSIGVRNHGDNY